MLDRADAFFSVHRLIGPADQIIHFIGRVIGDDADTAAYGDRVLAVIDGVVVEHALDFNGAAHAVFLIAFCQNKRELVTAEARDHIVFPHLNLEQAADRMQHAIARHVTKDIVDRLEVIEIDETKNTALIVAPGVGQNAPQFAVEAAPIEIGRAHV